MGSSIQELWCGHDGMTPLFDRAPHRAVHSRSKSQEAQLRADAESAALLDLYGIAEARR